MGLSAVVIVLAGCGSGGHTSASPKLSTVAGSGYRFLAPRGWRVRRTGPDVTVTSGAVDLVGVTRFRLARRYHPSLWGQAVPALDRAAGQLAMQLGGRLRAGTTVVLAGRRARRYEIGYERSGRQLVDRTAFVLEGRRELQLLCRFEAGGDDTACRTLFSSFRLG